MLNEKICKSNCPQMLRMLLVIFFTHTLVINVYQFKSEDYDHSNPLNYVLNIQDKISVVTILKKEFVVKNHTTLNIRIS